jgi:hypothetical protein
MGRIVLLLLAPMLIAQLLVWGLSGALSWEKPEKVVVVQPYDPLPR